MQRHVGESSGYEPRSSYERGSFLRRQRVLGVLSFLSLPERRHRPNSEHLARSICEGQEFVRRLKVVM